MELAVQLGRLHAVTARRTAEYGLRRSALGPQHDRRLGLLQVELAGETGAALESLGVPAGRPLLDAVGAVQAALAPGGPFTAYTHGDPCPDNWRLSGGSLRLIDFESGGLRCALVDGVFGRMMFPSCWCAGRVPERLLANMEAAYRAELAAGCPAATSDPLWRLEVARACAFWAWFTVATRLRPALTADSPWGIATLRPRILSRLEGFVAAPAVPGLQPGRQGIEGSLFPLDGARRLG